MFSKIPLHYIRRYPLTIFCVALIWYLCLFKPPRVEIVEGIIGFDKLVHVAMYLGTCGLFWCEYLRTHDRENWRFLIPVVVIAPILMSGGIEFIQNYVGRSGDWLDIAANTLGVLLAALLGHFPIRRFILKRKKQSTR